MTPQTAQSARLHAGCGHSHQCGMKSASPSLDLTHRGAVRQRRGTEGRKPDAHLNTAETEIETDGEH